MMTAIFLLATTMLLATVTAGPLPNSTLTTLYGWMNDSVVLKERYAPYELHVGYLQGSGPNLTFKVIVDQGTTQNKVDYTVSPQLVTISSTAPSVIEVDTFLDGLALEPDEQFTLRLELVGGSAPVGMLRGSLAVTLVDSDVLKVSMTSADYRVSESNGTMTVVIKKDKRIATPLPLIITPQTVALAMAWSDVTLPNIPTPTNKYSLANAPNRARGGHDFEPHTIVVQFPADEDSPISDLPVSVPIIDDAVNEAPEEHFVVRLDTTEGTSSLVEVGEQQVSLCTIVDNDSIRIGFTQPSYTITRLHYDECFEDIVKIAKEGLSEQSFFFLIEAVVVSPSSSISAVSNEVAHTLLTPNSRIVVQTLYNDEQEKGVDIYVDPYLLPPKTVAFELVISSELDPFFLPAKNLYQSTYVVIEQAN